MNQLTVVPATQTMLWPMQATERMALCRELATARLVPPAFQKSPADIFLAMNTIERLGLDFFLTIGECYVVQGKIGFSGKLAAGILNSSGLLAERLSYTYEGSENEGRSIVVSGRLQGEAEPRTVKVRLSEAKTTNQQWTKQPDQMLGYAGARTWGRRHLPEVLLGMRFEDEIEVEVKAPPVRKPPPEITGAPSVQPEPEPSTAVPGEAESEPGTEPEPRPEPSPIAWPNDSEDHDLWRGWCADFITLIRASPTLEEVGAWLGENEEKLEHLHKIAPKMLDNLEHAIETHRKLIKEGEAAPPPKKAKKKS